MLFQLPWRIARKAVRMLLPQGKHLAINHWFAVRLSDDVELASVHRIGPNAGTALDIGANEGIFSYALSKCYDRVIAFEVNPELSAQLERADIPNLQVIGKGLSSEARSMTLYIPFHRGRMLTGWASVVPGNFSGADQMIEKTVDMITLDSLQLPEVSFIKMDVEGHELEVLRGAEQTLRRHHPVLLLEIREQYRDSITALLTQLGYRQESLEERIGVVGAEYSFIFVPLSSRA